MVNLCKLRFAGWPARKFQIYCRYSCCRVQFQETVDRHGARPYPRFLIFRQGLEPFSQGLASHFVVLDVDVYQWLGDTEGLNLLYLNDRGVLETQFERNFPVLLNLVSWT